MRSLIMFIPLILLVPLAAAQTNTTDVIDVLLGGGSSQLFTCADNCSAVYNVTCTTQCSTCHINKTLAPGELYSFDQGSCDITFNCSQAEQTGPQGVVEFPAKLGIYRYNNTFAINYTVWDWLGNVYMHKYYDGISNSTMLIQEDDIGFQCPAQIDTPINYETCQQYFEKWMRIDDPLLLQMATGQNTATQELVKCQGQLNSETELANRWQANHDSIMGDFQRCSGESNNKTAEINRLNGEMVRMQQAMVPASNQTLLIIIIVVLGIIILISFDIIPLGWR